MSTVQRILHVDDDPDIRQITEISLVNIGGFTVETCDSGYQALEKVREFAPDLILLDVMMPGMDGPTTLKELQKSCDTAEINVIFMTAKVQTHEIEQYLKMGVKGVISKPFDPATLKEKILEITGSL